MEQKLKAHTNLSLIFILFIKETNVPTLIELQLTAPAIEDLKKICA